MFDGAFDAYRVSPAHPPRPASIDTRAMLPALRAQGSAITVQGLAYLTGVNALEAARWGAAPGLGEADPQGRFREALALLADACARHQALTDHDGLQLARITLTMRFNREFADHVLAPLDPMDIAIDAMICTPEPGDPPPPAPRQPSSAERQQAAGGMLGLAWADARLGGLEQALSVFHDMHQADGADTPGMATRSALAAVRGAMQNAADQGVMQHELQVVLDTWSAATAGPQIRVDGAGPG